MVFTNVDKNLVKQLLYGRVVDIDSGHDLRDHFDPGNDIDLVEALSELLSYVVFIPILENYIQQSETVLKVVFVA